MSFGSLFAVCIYLQGPLGQADSGFLDCRITSPKIRELEFRSLYQPSGHVLLDSVRLVCLVVSSCQPGLFDSLPKNHKSQDDDSLVFDSLTLAVR